MEPLKGIRVLELSTYVAGPSCARILADWGADVIKVEPLNGDIYRKLGYSQGLPAEPGFLPSFDNENANKRYLALDLKNPEGMETLHRAIASADALITNYRPQALIKMGLDYKSLSEKYPGLVFASCLGYGDKGPDKDLPGFDFTAFYARSGFMADLSAKGAPLINPVSGFGDHLAGLALAGGIAAALVKRTNTGVGDKVEAGLYQAGIYAFSNVLLGVQFGRKFPKDRTIGPSPLVASYRCADGEFIFLSATDYVSQWAKVCNEVLGHPELAEDPRFWPQKEMMKHCPEVFAIMDEIFATQPTDYWLDKLVKADIAHSRVAHWKDIITDEQAWANNYIRKHEYENGKSVVFSNSPVSFASIPEAPFRTSRAVGADTTEILESLGYSVEEIEKLRTSGAIRT